MIWTWACLITGVVCLVLLMTFYRERDASAYDRALALALAVACALNFIGFGTGIGGLAEHKKQAAREAAAFIGPPLPTTPTDNVQGSGSQ